MTGWRWLTVRLLAGVLQVWGRTIRFAVDPDTDKCLRQSDEPALMVLWHNRLFLSAEMFRCFRQRRQVHGLVSASKDGAWLAAFYRIIGIVPVRGSSSNFGREAARSLIEAMHAGHDVGITPDGPRGPMYALEPGVLVVARRNRASMILFGVEFSRAWRLKSWDRFYIPWPFSKVIIRGTVLPEKKPDGSKFSAEEVRAALMAINPDLPERPQASRVI